MRILVVGGAGTVGKCAVAALKKKHELVIAGRSSGDVTVDITDPESIQTMYRKVGKVDAVVACVGHTPFAPVDKMTSEQFLSGLTDKLMGQVNLVLHGLAHVNDNGSFTLTGGILDREPVRMGVNASTVDAAINGFVMAAAIEMPRGIRINVVSPGLLQESAVKYDGYFPGHEPVSSARVGTGFVKSVEGLITGQVISIH